MPKISEILESEERNHGDYIRLYPEGVFYKAYECSAWLACICLHKFMVKKKFVNNVGREIVSVGFPKASLEKWAGSRKLEFDTDSVRIVLEESEKELFTIEKFKAWKTSSVIGAEKTCVDERQQEVCRQLLEFPIESKTPMECMMFLYRMKQNLNKDTNGHIYESSRL